MRIIHKIIFSLGILLFFYSPDVFAYEVETHAFLTKEAVDFYNKNFPGNKIPEGLELSIINGARHEDDSPRWMNHFYDPVYNRGLTAIPGDWLSSKNWAQAEDRQISVLYNPLLNTTIAGLLAVTDPDELRKTDFTWQRAIRDYVKGDKDRAFQGLGHILHLIEDASVPDHTRNDPHPAFNHEDTLETGSPYELWTANFNLDNPDNGLSSRLLNKKPIILGDVNSYFDGLATYSNNNFYSKDTINSDEYKLPKPDYFGLGMNGKRFGFKKDNEFGDYYLVRADNKLDWNIEDGEMLKNKFILTDYWDRLSVKSVQYAAGVIDLFFKEAEKAKNDPNFVKESPRSFLAQAIDVMRDFFGSFSNQAGDGLKLVSEIKLDDKNQDSQKEIVKSDLGNEVKEESRKVELETEENKNIDEQDEDAIEFAQKLNQESTSTPLEIENQAVQEENPVQKCVFVTDKPASRQKLLINEMAWMGGQNSANDEWFELKNISGSELDISGWQIFDKDEQIKISFKGGTKVSAGGFLILERTDDNSVPGIPANVIYSGALSNSDEGLRLFDDKCNIIDEVLASSEWPAGDSASRRTMERKSDLSWNTYSANGTSLDGMIIMGTPKNESSQAANLLQTLNGNNQLKILISEVQITGGTGQSDNEFIELYNPGSSAIDLSALPLKLHIRNSSGTDGHKTLTFTNSSIPAKGYFLIGPSSGYTGSASLDATYSVSSGNKLVSNGGVYISKSASADVDVLDKVGWGTQPAGGYESAAFLENPIANQSISRQSENDSENNSVDFIKSKPTPKNSSASGGFLIPDAWGSVSVATPNHLVISEVYPDRTGANQDFIELYNPNATSTPDVDISGWSIQILSANATSTDKITKKNFETGNKAPSRGFFLIGIDSYSAADMNWASGSLNSTDGATIFLVNGTTTISDFEDSRIVDQVAYGSGSGLISPETSAISMPIVGSSFERKALENNSCLSPQNAGEFSGNGCDTDGNANDFEFRTVPKPQKNSSLIEPRFSPVAVKNFSLAYSTTTAQVSMGWDPAQDYSGATSTMQYVISYATSSSPVLRQLAELTATNTYNFKTDEVGVTYNFSIIAKDKDGLSSSATGTTSIVPSQLSNLYFYKDTRIATSTKYLVEFSYSNYPFVQDPYWDPVNGTWKIVVFYLNKEAPSETELNTSNNWQPVNSNEILGIIYSGCAGGSAPRFSLILPDIESQCNSGGGIANLALNYGSLEDPHVLLELASTTSDANFTADQDFITIGTYSLFDAGGGSQRFKLVALDRSKHYFQSATPVHQVPSRPDNLELKALSNSSVMRVIWDRSNDADSIDNALTYEINYSTTTLSDSGWIATPNASLDSGEGSEVNGRQFTKVPVEPNNNYNIALRSKDDFGNLSSATTTTYFVPDVVPPYGISNISWGYINSSSTVEVNFDANAYPFMTANKASAILLFLNQSPPTSYSFSNSSERWNVGGVNSVLKFQYSTCQLGSDSLLGGLFMSNANSCPNGGSGLKKDVVRSDLSSGQTSFTTTVTGVLTNGSTDPHTFNTSDYVTMGFYELQGSTFQEVSVYNKKIYFQE